MSRIIEWSKATFNATNFSNESYLEKYNNIIEYLYKKARFSNRIIRQKSNQSKYSYIIHPHLHLFWLLSIKSFHGNEIFLHLRQREVKRIEMVERNALFLFFLHSVLINYEWISFVEDNKRALHNTFLEIVCIALWYD